MKVRFGFVSNSSTSSFCLFGVYLEQERFEEMLEKLGYKRADDSYEWYRPKEEDETFYLDDLLDDFGGGVTCGEEEMIALGKTPEEMELDETRRHFEERVKAELKAKLPLLKDEDFGWQEDYYAS
jgi:hypothetical protein